MEYWELVPDMTVPRRWLPSCLRNTHGELVDERQFIHGQRVNGYQDLVFDVRVAGRPLDFTHAIFNLPVVRPETAEVLQSIDPEAVQRLPVSVVGYQEPFEIVIITKLLDCIDRSVTKIRTWTKADIPRLEGKYKAVDWLRIDRKAAEGHHIFRIKDWPVPIIISDRMRQAFEKAETTGIEFLPR